MSKKKVCPWTVELIRIMRTYWTRTTGYDTVYARNGWYVAPDGQTKLYMFIAFNRKFKAAEAVVMKSTTPHKKLTRNEVKELIAKHEADVVLHKKGGA